MSSARIRTMSGWRLGLEVMVREMQFQDTRMGRNNLAEDIFSKFFFSQIVSQTLLDLLPVELSDTVS